MYVWITARRIKEGMMDDFLRAWQDPCIAPPVSPSSSQGRSVYALHPTDNPNEIWGMGFFDSLETIENFNRSTAATKRKEALAPFVEETLWERQFEARPWSESDRPPLYSVYFRQTPLHRYKLVCICPNPKQALEEADALMERAKASGYTEPEWTMRAFQDREDAPASLPRTEGHAHAVTTG